MGLVDGRDRGPKRGKKCGEPMIYLASTSPRRKGLLKDAGITFKTIRPDYEEKNERERSPAALVKKHALEKAVSCAAKVKGGRILGSDTIVYCAGHVIGK